MSLTGQVMSNDQAKCDQRIRSIVCDEKAKTVQIRYGPSLFVVVSEEGRASKDVMRLARLEPARTDHYTSTRMGITDTTLTVL